MLIRYCAIIFGCLALGELIVYLTGIHFPSSIIGMILLNYRNDTTDPFSTLRLDQAALGQGFFRYVDLSLGTIFRTAQRGYIGLF